MSHIGHTWKDEGVILEATRPLEDFVVSPAGAVPGGARYDVHYVAGPTFQDLRICSRVATTPRGPFPVETETQWSGGGHTRLYRGRIDEHRRLITAVWPGVPFAGLWLFTDHYFGMTKELVLAPRPPFDAVAGNPAVIRNGVGWHYIAFEGRAAGEQTWTLYGAHWSGMPGDVPFEIQALCPGANPSFLRVGDTVFLYYSKLNSAGLFDVALLTQEVA